MTSDEAHRTKQKIDDGVRELYIARSEYVTAGLIASHLGIVLLFWVQLTSNYRRAGWFSEDQYLLGLTLLTIFITIGYGYFAYKWVTGKHFTN